MSAFSINEHNGCPTCEAADYIIPSNRKDKKE